MSAAATAPKSKPYPAENWLNSWVMSNISCTDMKSLKPCFRKASNSTSKALDTNECKAQQGVACLLTINRNLCPGAFHFGRTETEPTGQEDRGTHVRTGRLAKQRQQKNASLHWASHWFCAFFVSMLFELANWTRGAPVNIFGLPFTKLLYDALH